MSDAERVKKQERVERLHEKVCNARAKLIACVAVFALNDDEHNRKQLKASWETYDALQDEYHAEARR